MGEIIKDLGAFKINNNDVRIELNRGYDKGTSEYDIHIQSERIQYYLSGADFIKFATAVICANERLSLLKEYKEEEGNA